jgi:hypothetical protein
LFQDVVAILFLSRHTACQCMTSRRSKRNQCITSMRSLGQTAVHFYSDRIFHAFEKNSGKMVTVFSTTRLTHLPWSMAWTHHPPTVSPTLNKTRCSFRTQKKRFF